MRFVQRKTSAVPTPAEQAEAPPWEVGPNELRLRLFRATIDVRRPWYVTVDEQVEGMIGLVSCPWPVADGNGLPVFPPSSLATWHRADRLQAVVNALRSQSYLPIRMLDSAVEIEQRPLRIGDTFAVIAEELESEGAWEVLYDITREARAAARARLAVVTHGALDNPARLFATGDDDQDVGSGDEPEPPRRGLAGPGIANPAV